MAKLPPRWRFKHNAFYYVPRPSERAIFDGKTWFRLADNYPDALRAFADRKELEMGGTLGSVLDRYQVEALPRLKPNTRASYGQAISRLRSALGHNKCRLIEPQVVYQYLEAVAKARTMNVANMDLKVLNVVLDKAIRWGVVGKNVIKGAVKYYGKRDGLKKERSRYVQDWELAEWQKVATPIQKAFAAIVACTGSRKTDVLRILLQDRRPEGLRIVEHKVGKERIWTWTDALREAVSMGKATRHGTSMFLFTNRNGECFVNNKDQCKPFDKSWRRTMSKALKNTELEHSFTAHDLRAKTGSDAETEARAQELLGHTNPAMTRKHYRRDIEIVEPAK